MRRRSAGLQRGRSKMARALGMNPKKLPGLRPSPQEKWKLPVGEFIEECYGKRFGGHPRGEPDVRRPGSRKPSTLDGGSEPERVGDPAWQVSDLVCYLMNLADDLQQWLSHGSIDPEVLPQVREELREIANALDARAPISPIPAIPLPPRKTRPRFLTATRSGTHRRRDPVLIAGRCRYSIRSPPASVRCAIRRPSPYSRECTSLEIRQDTEHSRVNADQVCARVRPGLRHRARERAARVLGKNAGTLDEKTGTDRKVQRDPRVLTARTAGLMRSRFPTSSPRRASAASGKRAGKTLGLCSDLRCSYEDAVSEEVENPEEFRVGFAAEDHAL